MTLRTLFFAISALLVATPALADEDESGRQIKYKERTDIDFEGVDVTGEMVKPSGQLLMEATRQQFNPLIRLRENFDKEMKQSVDEVK